MKTTLSIEERKERVRQLYTIDEMADIIGYNDNSIDKSDIAKLDKICPICNKKEFDDLVVEIAIRNGNFQEAIKTNKRIAL